MFAGLLAAVFANLDMRILSFIYCLLFSAAAQAQPKERLLQIQYGKFAVGLSQQTVAYADGIRLVFTAWYPAKKNQAAPKLNIRDCLLLDGMRSADELGGGAVQEMICGDDCRIGGDSLARFLNTATGVEKNAPALSGKFPLVLWSYRHGTEYYQFAMSEFLASHGFVVYTLSRLNPPYVMPWEVDSVGRINLYNSYLAEMDIMLSHAKSNKQVDTAKIALFSWSYGGDAAMFFQQQHPEIDCVFGFSSINFTNSFFLGKQLDALLEPIKLRCPYYLYYEETSRRGVQFSPKILHPAHQNISTLTLFPRLWHGNFNYLEGHVAGSLNLSVVQPWSKPGKDAVAGYETMCQLALWQLQGDFKGLSRQARQQKTDRLQHKLPKGFFIAAQAAKKP
jgi:pimeloyl-ACP methyl ester carboxylesterase